MAFAGSTQGIFKQLVQQESGGRPGAIGPMTQWGRAKGMTQMLDGTAKEMAAKLGMPWRPDLMRGKTPEAAKYQIALGKAYFDQGLKETGNVRDALRYYHGGPNRGMWGRKTNRYADQILARTRGL